MDLNETQRAEQPVYESLSREAFMNRYMDIITTENSLRMYRDSEERETLYVTEFNPHSVDEPVVPEQIYEGFNKRAAERAVKALDRNDRWRRKMESIPVVGGLATKYFFGVMTMNVSRMPEQINFQSVDGDSVSFGRNDIDA